MELKEIQAFFSEKDRFARHCGVELLEVTEGSAKARMEIGEDHLNGVGIVHGAAIFTLADLVFAAASNSHGTVSVAINANINFIKATSTGVLTAEAEEVSFHPRLGTYEIKIRDGEGDLVATFQGTVYRKRDALGSIL